MNVSELQNVDKPQVYPGIVDAVICINLSTRNDRRQKILEEFPYQFYFYTAEPHADPIIGCTQSHYNCITWAKQQNLKNVMIIEDDVKIVKELNSNTPSFPMPFDMLYLGGICLNIYGAWNQPWTKGRMVCLHAYIVNDQFYDTLLNTIVFDQPTCPVDVCVANLHEHHECYIITEPLCIQDEGYSDIEKRAKWKSFKWPKAGEMCIIP
jgi:GR25 family glycosyltransferase involved in LPS biosynthesis